MERTTAAVVAIILLTGIAAGEYIARDAPYEEQKAVIRYDPQLVWTFVPHLDIPVFGHRFQTNAAGFRDEPFQDRSEAVRIAVLGDSYTVGARVPEEERFTERIERRLEQAGVTAQVYNMGVSAYGTDQEVLTYRHVARGLDPDIVLLMVAPNDLRDTYGKGLFERNGSHAVVDHDNRAFHVSPIDRFFWTLSSRSALFFRTQQLFGVKYGTFERLYDTTTNGVTFEEVPIGEQHNILFRANRTPAMEDAIQLWSALVNTLDRDARRDGGRLLVVPLPIQDQFTTLPEKPGLDRYAVERIVTNITDHHGIPHQSVLPAAQNVSDPSRLFLKNNYHYSAAGHRLIADTLTPTLIDWARATD